MRNSFIFAVFAVAVLASQVWAAESWVTCTDSYAGFCKWGSNCNEIKTCTGGTSGSDCDKAGTQCSAVYDNCVDNGYLYTDSECKTWSEIGNDPDFIVVYCRWTGDCVKLMSEEAKDHCEIDGSVFSDDQCTNWIGGKSSSGTQSSSTSADGSSSSGTTYQYCVYATGSYCLEGPFTACETGGQLSNSCPFQLPITINKPVHSNFMSVMQNAVNLQVTGSVVVQVFDLKGDAVRTFRLAGGNYIVPLADLPQGLYVVKANSASWTQIVKIAKK